MKNKILIFSVVLLTIATLAVFFTGIGASKKSHYEEAEREIVAVTEIYAANYNDNITENVPDDIRITVIDEKGIVLKDSEDSSIVGKNHLDRDEVIAAVKGEPKVYTRYSSTLDQDMVYYALKVPVGESFVIVRAAVPVASVNNYVKKTVPSMVYVLLCALFLSFVASFFMTAGIVKPLREIKDNLVAVNNGTYHETVRHSRDGEVNAMLSEIDDISEKLKIALRDATDDKAKLDYILDNVSDGIVALDSEDNVSLINRNATRIFPVGAEGKRYTVLSADPDFNKAVSETLKTGKDGHFEFSEDGKIYLVNVKPLDNGYTVIVLSDVTAMKTGERMRSEFFANASHELKTPLTAVKAFNDMIALEPSGDKVKEFSQKIDKEVSRIISLINDMLDLSKLESGRPLSPVTVDLAATAREVAESLAPLANEKKVSVSVSGEGKAFLEREHAVELLKNLTENGIRYNNAGGHVSVIIAEEDDSVSMTVKDDGIGIEEEHLGRICERFYRVNKSRSRETGGTGLGLSIVKHICEIYGADLSITSKIGVGTDITIVFHNSALPSVSAVSE